MTVETTRSCTSSHLRGVLGRHLVCRSPASFSDNQPVFLGVDNYTRRGDFAARQERLPGQRPPAIMSKALGSIRDRQHDRQRSAGSEVRQRLPAGGADIGGELSRQPGELSADHQARQFDSGSELLRRRISRRAIRAARHARRALYRCDGSRRLQK